jgi:hypothetical protein
VISLTISEDNGLRGIEDIASTTSGVVKDEAGNEINIRGGRTNETAIIVDGVLTHSPLSEMKKSDNVKLVNPDVRSDFRDAIFWSPYTVTDGEGYAIVDVKYPG